MANKFEEIIVEHGAIRLISEETGRNRKTVSDALKRPRNTSVHREIRELAIAKFNGFYVSDLNKV